MTPEQLMVMAGLQAIEGEVVPQLAPPDDLRLIVASLLDLLAGVRQEFDRYDPSGALRRRYESFACALRESGFQINETQERLDRARGQRRLGELAERSGHVDAAIVWYERALRSWSAIGCRRRLEYLKRHLP